MALIDIRIIVLIVVISVLLIYLLSVFKKAIITWLKNIWNKLEEQIKFRITHISFERFLKDYLFVVRVIQLEFFIFSLELLYILVVYGGYLSTYLNSLDISNLINFLYESNTYNVSCSIITCHITGSTEISLNHVSVLIALLTGFVIYAYFFGMISEDPDRLMADESRKKFYFVFEYSFWIAVTFSLLVSLLVAFGLLTTNRMVEFILVGIAWINILLLMPLTRNFERLFEDYKNLDLYNYKLIEKEVITQLKDADKCSLYIFILTLEIATAAYIMGHFNFLSLVFIEISLILVHLWISKLNHVPREKYTIQLKTNEFLNDVYIIQEVSNEYLIALLSDNQKREVMKTSINQIFYKEK